MNYFLTLVTILFQGYLFGQKASNIEDNRQEIWNSIVQTIIEFDQDKVFQMTNFPLEGDWYSQEGQSEAELRKLYKGELDYFYPQEMRDYLKNKDYTILVAHPYKGSVAFAFTYFDEFLESTTIVDFAKVADEFRIIAITIK